MHLFSRLTIAGDDCQKVASGTALRTANMQVQAATEADLLVCTQGGEFCRCQQVLSLIDQLDDDEKMLEEIRSIFKVRHPSGMPASP